MQLSSSVFLRRRWCLTMITPTVIILLVLLFRDGTSHPVKAISGSLVVSGCGCRYGNSAQCFAALHFPSLHTEAAPVGFSPWRTQRQRVHFSASASSVLLFWLSLLCFEAQRNEPRIEIRRHPGGCMKISIAYFLFQLKSKNEGTEFLLKIFKNLCKS